MKALVLLLVVLGLVWLWRHRERRPLSGSPSAGRGATAPPREMVDCPVCGVHLPLEDATAGKRGRYCSVEHRQQAEG